MFVSRSQVVCLLLIFLSISAFHNRVLGARYLKEEDSIKNPQVSNSGSSKNEVESSFTTVERTVPSCPDPLHNK